MNYADAGESEFSWIVAERHGVAVLSATGELDMASAEEFRRGLTEAISHVRPPLVVVDLRGVEFCDSSGLNALIRASSTVQAAGGRLVLSGLRPRVARLLLVTGLDKHFPCAEDVAAATALMAGTKASRTATRA
ncbi:STAS domain-containing protein [Nonomuraea sp. NPDC050783]|uniref:STAS domain-containing protein n=1 Tax=Nonomuraea sp. NPDC050783 TaxID=3154634 RepID=UPI003466442C